MNAKTTSLAPANSIRGEWKRFARFLKHPTLPARAPMPSLASLAAILRLFLLDLLVMGVLLTIVGAVMSAGIDVPQTALAGMDIEPAIIFAVVIFAPLAEEVAFRGWLSGRPGHIAGLLLAIPAGLLATGIFAFLTTGTLAQIWLAVPIALGAGTLVALAVVYRLRRRRAMGWFQKLFPLFFWLSTICFASVHLFNFELEQMAMALPMILPQFATGTMLGYLRVNYGLWASIMLHMLHNAAFISLVLLGGGAA